MFWNLFYHSGECRKGSRNFCLRLSHFAAHKNRINVYQIKSFFRKTRCDPRLGHNPGVEAGAAE